MKIEKVNENQIRCTLTKKDLEERQIDLKELAYGSEKAKKLFRDMVSKASYELGFEIDGTPLMVEAIPMPSDAIVLLITKVEYPDELDTRFSHFSDIEEGEYEVELEQEEPIQMMGADDILGLFRMNEQREVDVKSSKDAKQEQELIKDFSNQDFVKTYLFTDFETIERFAKVVTDIYKGENTLYKDLKQGRYVLNLHKNDHTPEEFNKICNMATDYGVQMEYNSAMEAHLEEHGRLILRGCALQTIGQI